MRVALHACCGPCALEPLDALASVHEVVLVFANPNIQPVDEYRRRLDTLLQWAAGAGVRVVETVDESGVWERLTGDIREPRAARCRACYEARLAITAEWAARNGCDAIATTLTVSPYQDVAAIDEVGRVVASERGLAWVGSDYRERFSEATRRSRDLGMYRQNYCGCLLSRSEAESQREARKAERAELRRTR